MSFNGSGTFQLNIGGYPYVANTLIKSADVNALLQDLANGLSLTVTRDGQMTLTGPLHMGNQLIDGIKNLQFGTTTSSPSGTQDGFFLAAAHTISVGINGSTVGSFTSTGLNAAAVGATTASTGAFTTLSAIVGAANTPGDAEGTVLGLVGAHQWTSGTSSNGMVTIHSNDAVAIDVGGELAFGGRYSGTAQANFGVIAGRKENGTAGDFAGYLSFGTRVNGGNLTERVRIAGSGDVTINAPASGVALQVNGISGNNIVQIGTATNPAAFKITQTDSGTASAYFGASTTTQGFFGTDQNIPIGLVTNNANRVNIAAAGNVTINAPASGVALTVNGVGNGPPSIAFSGNANGTHPSTTGIGFGGTANVSGGSQEIDFYNTNTGAVEAFRFLQLTSAGVATTLGAWKSNGVFLVGTTSAVTGTDVASFQATTNSGTVSATINNAGTSSIASLIVKSSGGTGTISVDSSGSFKYSSSAGSTNLADATVNFTNVGTTASAANAFLNGAFQNILKSTSARRYKTDIADMQENDVVSKLRPIRFRSRIKTDDQSTRFYGFVAEEVADVEPALVHWDAEGKPDGVQYDRIVVPLVAKVNQLETRLRSLERLA
jgi:hypothetical protein